MAAEEQDDLSLPVLIRERAKVYPDRVFLEHVDGREQTFADVYEEALHWAEILYGLGVAVGSPVCLMMRPSFEAHHLWLACGYLGAIEVPLNTDFRGPLLLDLLNASGAKVMIIHAAFYNQIVELADRLTALEHMIVVDGVENGSMGSICLYDLPSAERSRKKPESLCAPGLWDVATVIYTSGTTGVSKGVLVPWGLFALQMKAGDFYNYPTNSKIYAPYPIYHISGKGPVAAMAMHLGRVVIRPSFKTGEFWNDVHRHGCTHFQMLGAVPQFLMSVPEMPTDADNPLKHIIMIPVIDEYRDFARRFGATVTTQYGSTELGAPVGGPWDGLKNPQSCGRMRQGWDYQIVDKHDWPVGPGQVGELIVRPTRPWSSFLGYWNMPEATAAAWRNGWFHTGDAFKEDLNGDLYFVDRLKDAIRRRGENISSFEVEKIITSHPDVEEACAIAVPSEYGEDEVMVYVVPARDSSLSSEALLEYLVPIMPRFMVPRYLEFIEALPKTPTLKVQRGVLRDRGITDRTWDRQSAFAGKQN